MGAIAAAVVLLLARVLLRARILTQTLRHILICIQIWILTRIRALALTLALEMGLKEPSLQKFALFLTLPPSFLVVLLPHKLIPLQKEVFCIAVQFHIQKIQSLNAFLDFLTDLYTGGPSGIILGKWRDKVHVEGFLKQILGLPLKLSEAKERHVLQIRFGTFQEDLVSLLFRHDREVVAAYEGQVGEHAHLTVVGQIIGAVHELFQGATGPVIASVAAGQLLGGGRPSITHMQGCFPRRPPLDMPPLAQVPGHRVSEDGDVMEIPRDKTERLKVKDVGDKRGVRELQGMSDVPWPASMERVGGDGDLVAVVL